MVTDMNNKILLAVALLLISLNLCACEKEIETTETIETTTTTVANKNEHVSQIAVNSDDLEDNMEEITESSDSNDKPEYAQPYLNKIDELFNAKMANQFSLIYVNEDDIPELVAVNTNTDNMEDDVFLYTFYDNNVILLESGIVGMYACHLEYADHKNIIYTGGGDIGLSERFEKIENGNIKEVLSFEETHGFDDTTGETLDVYYIAEEEVTDEEYYNKKSELYDKYNPFTRIDYDGLHTLEFVYKDNCIQENLAETKPYLSYDEIVNALDLLLDDMFSNEDEKPAKETYGDSSYNTDEESIDGDYDTVREAMRKMGLLNEDTYSTSDFWVVVAAPDGGVNVRAGTGTEYEIIYEMLPNGTDLHVEQAYVTENGSLWASVDNLDQYGYVAMSQVSLP